MEIKNLTIEYTKEPSILYRFIYHGMVVYLENFHKDHQVVGMVFVNQNVYNFISSDTISVLGKIERWAEERT